MVASTYLASVVNGVGSFLDSSFVGLVGVEVHGGRGSHVHVQLLHRIISLVGVDSRGFEGHPFESNINGGEPRCGLRLETEHKTSKNKQKEQNFPAKQETHCVCMGHSLPSSLFPSLPFPSLPFPVGVNVFIMGFAGYEIGAKRGKNKGKERKRLSNEKGCFRRLCPSLNKKEKGEGHTEEAKYLFGSVVMHPLLFLCIL